MINVEYNQLDPLLRATGHPDGDVNCETGYSPFPGNINQVILWQNLSVDLFIFVKIHIETNCLTLFYQLSQTSAHIFLNYNFFTLFLSLSRKQGSNMDLLFMLLVLHEPTSWVALGDSLCKGNINLNDFRPFYIIDNFIITTNEKDLVGSNMVQVEGHAKHTDIDLIFLI